MARVGPQRRKKKGHVRPGMSCRHCHNLEVCMYACLYLYLLAGRGSADSTPAFRCKDPNSNSGQNCEFCGGQSGTGTGVSPVTKTPPVLHTHTLTGHKGRYIN